MKLAHTLRNPQGRALALLGLGAALAFSATAIAVSATAIAADQSPLPKEGTFSGAYYTVGTVKATRVGKELLLLVVDENGLSQSNGLLDHMTWHCWA